MIIVKPKVDIASWEDLKRVMNSGHQIPVPNTPLN